MSTATMKKNTATTAAAAATTSANKSMKNSNKNKSKPKTKKQQEKQKQKQLQEKLRETLQRDLTEELISKDIEPGSLVQIHGMVTAQALNTLRALVLDRAPQDTNTNTATDTKTNSTADQQRRWVVRVEDEATSKGRKCIKPSNLQIITDRKLLPTGSNRGRMRSMNDVKALCELLVQHDASLQYVPSEIMFMGIASQTFCRLGQENFDCFDPVAMEQLGGILALANICLQGEEPACESVVFALLEGPSMYVDVFLQNVYGTRLIMSNDDPKYDDMPHDEFDYNDYHEGSGTHSSNCCDDINCCVPSCPKEHRLTPDQDSKPYVKAMKTGPLLLLLEVSKHTAYFGSCLWVAMSKSKQYHLFVQRLLRLMAREVIIVPAVTASSSSSSSLPSTTVPAKLSTTTTTQKIKQKYYDGKVLGPMVRQLFKNFDPLIQINKNIITMSEYNKNKDNYNSNTNSNPTASGLGSSPSSSSSSAAIPAEIGIVESLVLTEDAAHFILENVGSILSSPDQVTAENIHMLLSVEVAN